MQIDKDWTHHISIVCTIYSYFIHVIELGCIEPGNSMISLKTSFDVSMLNNIPEEHNCNIQSKHVQ